MTDARAAARHLLTIGRLAAYAGVTVKAVRVYHERGLLAEPPRDASGYRRYGADHAVQLVKIRTLAEAGVPLARIRARDWFARQEPGGETPPGADAAGLHALAFAEAASPAWNRIAELAAGRA